MQEKIIILDFGSQTTQLIGRRVRELNMYCEILPYDKMPLDDPSVIGVILSGSPFSVYDKKAFSIDLSTIRGRYPILGICYGAQFMAYSCGGAVEPADSREYGRARLQWIDEANPLMHGIEPGAQVWMSHGDTITALPQDFKIIASTEKVPVAAYQADGEKLWGVQFHPEVFHSECGMQLLRNFVVDICGGKQDWSAASFIQSTVAQLRQQLGNDKVVLGLSGGVDSSVAAVLLNKAIGKISLAYLWTMACFVKTSFRMCSATMSVLASMLSAWTLPKNSLPSLPVSLTPKRSVKLSAKDL